MRAALLLLGLIACATTARAQLEVSAQTSRSNFLLYERVDLLITLHNQTGSQLLLDNNEGHPWLSFLVSKHNNLPVRAERQSTFASLELKPDETRTLRVNLTPLFSFREEGQYRAEAVIDLPGQGQVLSQSVPFNVLKGKAIWTQTRTVNEEQRVYSLIRFSPDANTTHLYLRVENPSENVVYANISLGDLASYADPAVNFDPKGDIHILHPVAMSTYLYTRADSNGKVLRQTIFKTSQQIAPRLTKLEDGNVVVAGGMPENPNTPREKLSEGQHPQKANPSAKDQPPMEGQPDIQPVSAPAPQQ